jgi:hypothetical protein
VFQACGERRRLLAEDLGHLWVHRRETRLGQSSRQRGLPRFKHHQFVLDSERRDAVLDGLNELPNLFLDDREFAPRPRDLCDVLTAQKAHLGRETLAERCERAWLEEALTHGVQGAGFHFLPLDTAAVRAGSP